MFDVLYDLYDGIDDLFDGIDVFVDGFDVFFDGFDFCVDGFDGIDKKAVSISLSYGHSCAVLETGADSSKQVEHVALCLQRGLLRVCLICVDLLDELQALFRGRLC